MNTALTIGAVEQTMSSREIAELTGKNHADVLRDIRVMLEQLGEEAGLASRFAGNYIGENGRSFPQYQLPRRECLILVSGYNVAMRARIIDRWQELEAAAPALPNFADPVAAARAWADAEESKRLALAQLEEAKPAVAFVNRYVASETAKGFREVCKLLGAKEPHFRAFLRDEKIMYFLGGEWAPYAQHLEAGRFVVKTGAAASGHAFTRTLFTAKGVNWIAGQWAKYQLRSHVPLAQRTAGAGVHA